MLAAIDTYLGGFYYVVDGLRETGKWAWGQPLPDTFTNPRLTLLVEVFDGNLQDADGASLHHRLRWGAFCCSLTGWLVATIPGEVLCSPSREWTGGKSKALRQAPLGKLDSPDVLRWRAKNEHLRDAQAMVRSYQSNPRKWVPYAKWMPAI